MTEKQAKLNREHKKEFFLKTLDKELAVQTAA